MRIPVELVFAQDHYTRRKKIQHLAGYHKAHEQADEIFSATACADPFITAD